MFGLKNFNWLVNMIYDLYENINIIKNKSCEIFGKKRIFFQG